MDLDLPGSGKEVSQILSVFDYDTGKYKYYKAPMSAPPLTGHYRAPRGTVPEALALQVPANAVLAGEGKEPKGIIASFTPASPVGEIQQPLISSKPLLMAASIAVMVAFFLYSKRGNR